MARLEVACFDAPSALIAESAGAHRIELCEGYAVGGTTPSYQQLELLKSTVQVPIFVMIRPRGGDFVYSPDEFKAMQTAVVEYGQLADGFVFGVLDANGNVDAQRNSNLVGLAKGKPCTFHRAFDEAKDNSQGLEDIIACGFATILTSGGASSAEKGIDAIAALIAKAAGRISIMPGGSVRSSNIEILRSKAPVAYYHTSAIVKNGHQADASEITSIISQL